MASDGPLQAFGGPATSAAFLAGFGTFWLLGGLLFVGDQPAMFAVVAALGSALVWVTLRATSSVSNRSRRPHDGRKKAWFKWANILQYAGFAVVILVANLAGRPDLITAWIAAIVAIHFVPLAYVFGNPAQYLTAAAVLAWDAAAVAFAPMESTSRVALGTGAILWIASLVHLGRAYRARATSPSLPA